MQQSDDNNPNSISKSENETQTQTNEISSPQGLQLDENGWTNLHLAAIDNNREKVAEFIKQWPNCVDRKDLYGSTALHLAARWGHTSCVIQLLSQGKADVNLINNIGWSPLHCAAWEGELETVQLLLTSNLTVNSQTQLGWTPLHFAARWGYDLIARLLLDTGHARNDLKDTEGLSPAHQAAMMGRTKVLKLLYDRGLINIYDKTKEGKTIIDFAFTNRNTLNLFIEMDDKYGMTFLQHVSVHGHKKLFKFMLNYYSKKRNRYKGIFPKNDFSHLFTIKGREVEHAQIKEALVQDKILVVTGIAGLGKTALAKSYAWINQIYYQNNLFWVDCQNEESFKISFIKIARHLKIPTKKYDNERDFKTIVKDIFTKLNLNMGLLIFDNVNNLDEIRNYLTDNLIHIIIMSRNNEDNIWDDLNCLKLQPIAQESAIEIFEPLFQDELLKTTDREHIKQLTITLMCIPLALHIAKMHIIHKVATLPNFQLSSYIETIEDEKGVLQESFSELLGNELEKTVYSVVKVNLNEIILTHPQLHLFMTKLLISSSFLNPSLISIRCALKLSQLQVEELNYIQIYLRNCLCSISSNKVLMNSYALNLTLHYVKTQPNFKANCYKNVIKLIINNEYPHHNKTVLCFAKDFDEIIKEFRITNLLKHLTTYGCVENLATIFSGLERTEIDKYVKKYNLLNAAVKSGDIKTVEFMYQYDNNIKKLNDMGHSMIWEAIQKNDTEVLNFLISKGASLDYIDKLNKSPLHRAAFLGRTDVVKLLLEKEVDPNIRNKFRRTPLHYAAMEGHNDVIEELLKHPKIKIDARDHYRRSPVFETVRCFQIESLKLFIERKARINTKDNLDLSPVRLAKLQKNKQELLNVFKQYGYYEENESINSCSFCGKNCII